jgi:hypothetical protein
MALSRRETNKRVRLLLNEGLTKEEIFLQVYREGTVLDSETLAKNVRHHPSRSAVEKYKVLKFVLVALLVLGGIAKMISTGVLLLNLEPIFLLLVLIVPLINVLLIVYILRNNRSAYLSTAIFTAWSIRGMFTADVTLEEVWPVLVYIGLTIGIATFMFFKTSPSFVITREKVIAEDGGERFISKYNFSDKRIENDNLLDSNRF